jgi:transaldolase
MKIFLDTANISDIESVYNTGLLDGITTNPTLIMKSGRDPVEVIKEISTSFPTLESISAEVVGSTAEEMILQADAFRSVANVTIKVPCTVEGLKACKSLREDGFTVNVTLIFSAAQAVLAAKAGATYVSPFVGRLDDQSVAGLEVVRSISDLYRIHRIETKVLSASIRSVQRAVRSWYNGAEICTLPPKIFWQMYDHVLTDKGLDMFDHDWKEVQNRI